MITMRYAENLALGHGLVWNLGEHIEGYTNFLWAIFLSIPHLLNIDKNYTFAFALFTNAILFFISAILINNTILKTTKSKTITFLSVAIFAFSLPLAYWGSMGFETSLIVLCTSLAIYSLHNGIIDRKPIYFFVASISLGVGFLTRDSYAIIIFAIISSFLTLQIINNKFSLKELFLLALFPAIFKLLHLIFRLSYYGEILPNTYYLKAGNWDKLDQISQGSLYAIDFLFLSIGPIIALLSYAFINQKQYFIDLLKKNFAFFVIFCVSIFSIALQTFYVVWVGGDVFPNNRFFVSIMPFVTILVAVSLHSLHVEQTSSSITLPRLALILYAAGAAC